MSCGYSCVIMHTSMLVSVPRPARLPECRVCLLHRRCSVAELAAQAVCAAGGHDTVTASSDFGDAVMTGEEFRARVHNGDATLNQDAFNRLWPQLDVLARCSPQDKFTIIQGCQAYRLPGDRRDIVAMTGALTSQLLVAACGHSGPRTCPRCRLWPYRPPHRSLSRRLCRAV